MDLRAWANDEFGARGMAKAARYLGVRYKTFYSWVTLERFPSMRQQQMIRIKTRGRVDIMQMQADFLYKKDAKLLQQPKQQKELQP
ncbi:hypothetical protein [Photobacterium leiognathi]|uniref:hypothetical protein n=1 Tax=Photobacterium leiognathi TaxID=553611 RepID=UPI000D16898E|nr:hypothetical protein [Photobacterium leiognathi]PSW53044.1 hypothetical protein C0W50_19745 [Photobacterium leiognathi subsp. mandapamensis]